MSTLQFQTGGLVGIEIAIASKQKILRTSLDLKQLPYLGNFDGVD
jgi:hypothetical protein